MKKQTMGFKCPQCGGYKPYLRYMIVPVETPISLRYGILFLGESAVQNMVHFKFNVAL